MDYEAGTPAWDIGQILTIHAAGTNPGEFVCDRVVDLRRTAISSLSARERLERAQRVPCNCGREITSAETTTLRRERHAAAAAAESQPG